MIITKIILDNGVVLEVHDDREFSVPNEDRVVTVFDQIRNKFVSFNSGEIKAVSQSKKGE